MSKIIDIKVPDIGDFEAVDVIEVLVKPGDSVKTEDSLITLESDKASMDIPSPESGTIETVKVESGQKVSQGDIIATIKAEDSSSDESKSADKESDDPDTEKNKSEQTDDGASAKPQQKDTATRDTEKKQTSTQTKPAPLPPIDEENFSKVHASPAVRKFARELGADLTRINGSGNKGRILKEDVQNFVKQALSSPGSTGATGGISVAPVPEVDFAAYGEIETHELSNINKLTGKYVHSSWVNIPHVTQFDEADITELEEFRKQLNAEYKNRGIKVTIIAFLMKAVVSALKEHPRFNSSLSPGGEQLVFKKYYHLGVAVDTPDGLVVPVIQNVDKKSLIELATEIVDVAKRARDKKVKIDEMKGGCFTISSLGGVGGTAFTPIVNQPEVAILGASRSAIKPVYENGEFVPRLILPLSLSYDHRVIDGAAAARFTTFLSDTLSDVRRLLL